MVSVRGLRDGCRALPEALAHTSSGYSHSNTLDHHSSALVDLWKRFNHLFPAGDRSIQSANSVPTISTLFRAIDQAQEAWDEKQARGFGPAKGRFLNFAETMSEYSYLFSVVPSGDRYISLITGVVSSVVKVSEPCTLLQGTSLILFRCP